MWPYLRRHTRDVVLVFGAALAGMAITAVLPLLIRAVVDDAIVPDATGDPSQPTGAAAAGHAGAGLVRFGLSFARRFGAGRLGIDVEYDMRNDIYDHLHRLDFARHDELQSRPAGVAGQQRRAGRADAARLPALHERQRPAVLPVAGVHDPPVAAADRWWRWSPCPTLMVMALRLRKAVYPSQLGRPAAGGRAGHGGRGGHQRGPGGQGLRPGGPRAGQAHRVRPIRLFGARMRNARISAKRQSVMQTVPALAQVAILALGGWLAMDGQHHARHAAGVPDLPAPAGGAGPPGGGDAGGGLDRPGRGRAHLRAARLDPRRGRAARRPGACDGVRGRGRVRRRQLRLPALRAGARPASACGWRRARSWRWWARRARASRRSRCCCPASTTPSRARITLDGVDVRDLQLAVAAQPARAWCSRRASCSPSTIRDNLRYGRPDAADEEIVRAARWAQADGFIEALPDGYDTVVGERGLTLSGGQRQRIALARALLTDPQVLLLDDATSSIDVRTEEEIHDTLRQVMRGRTTILVAHRRSTLNLADRIVVLDGGRVVDTGTHDELVGRCRLYRLLLGGPTTTSTPWPRRGWTADRAAADDRRATAGTGTATATTARPTASPSRRGGSGTATRDPGRHPAPELPGGPPGRGRRLRRPDDGRRGAAGGMGMMGFARLSDPPTPELLAQIEALPPIVDEPDVDPVEESRPAPDVTFRQVVRPQRRRIAWATLLVGANALATLAGPYLISVGVTKGVQGDDLGWLMAASGMFLVSAVAVSILLYASTLVSSRIGQELLLGLRIRVFAHLQRLGLDYYDREMTGRIMTRMTSDIEALQSLLQSGFIDALVQLVTFVGAIVILTSMNAELALVVLAVVPPLIIATVWFRPAQRQGLRRGAGPDRGGERQPGREHLGRPGGPGLRPRAAEHGRVPHRGRPAPVGPHRLHAHRLHLLPVRRDAVQRRHRAGAVGGRLPGRATAAWRSAPLFAFVLYLTAVFAPIQQLSQVFDTYQQGRVAMDRIHDLLAVPVSVRRERAPGRPRPAARRAAVRGRVVRLRRGPRPGPAGRVAHGGGRARPWPSWARPAPASPRWSSWPPGSTTPRTGASWWTAPRWSTWTWRRSAPSWATCPRRRSCSPGRSGTTSPTPAPTPATPRSRPRPGPWGRTTS